MLARRLELKEQKPSRQFRCGGCGRGRFEMRGRASPRSQPGPACAPKRQINERVVSHWRRRNKQRGLRQEEEKKEEEEEEEEEEEGEGEGEKKMIQWRAVVGGYSAASFHRPSWA